MFALLQKLFCEFFCFYIDIREPRKSLYLQGFRAWLSLFETDFYVRLGKGKTSMIDDLYYHHEGVTPDCILTGREVIESQISYRNDYVTTVWLGLHNRLFLLKGQGEALPRIGVTNAVEDDDQSQGDDR